MDEISQGSERDPRLSPKSRRAVATAAIAGLVTVAVVFGLTRGGGHQSAAAPRASATTVTATVTATATPVPQEPPPPLPAPQRISLPNVQIVLVPGSQIVSVYGSPLASGGLPTPFFCHSALQKQLGPGWRAGSLRVGPLWLIAGRQLGYVRLGGGPVPGGSARGRTTPTRKVQMFVHVDSGAVVIMQAAAGAGRYFHFLDGAGNPLSGRGVVLVSCAGGGNGDSSAGGFIDLYNVGFSIAAGHTASVEVWTSSSAGPVWLTFSAPARPA